MYYVLDTQLAGHSFVAVQCMSMDPDNIFALHSSIALCSLAASVELLAGRPLSCLPISPFSLFAIGSFAALVHYSQLALGSIAALQHYSLFANGSIIPC